MTAVVGVHHHRGRRSVDVERGQHHLGDRIIVEQVCADFARTLKSYNISSISGDRFAGIWPVEQFRKFNIRYEQSAEPKSDLYQSLLPLINSRRIDLLDHPKLINQLIGLERRTSRGGRDSIDHMPGGHDDICNAVAGLASINNRYGGNSFIV